MSIEILENTLIKLLVRRGTDADRKNIVLEAGELGYTTDMERLFVGDGTTSGGILVGNKYKGQNADATNLAPCEIGDYAFETDTNSLKVVKQGNGSTSTDWLTVANLISAGNTTIDITNGSIITVGTLSAGNFDKDSLGNSLEISSNRISLSSTISIDNIQQRTVGADSYLKLPSKLKINAVNYNFPATEPTNNTFLGSDASGNLNWAIPNIISTGVAPTTASVLPVGTIVPFASASNDVPYGWLECDGAQYASNSDYSELSAVIGTAYNTGGETADHFRVPNLLSKALYGSENPASSTLMPVTTAAHTTPGLSAFGANFIIKAIGGVTAPTLTVKKNLVTTLFNPTKTDGGTDKTEVEFNPLSGNVVIERPAPGMTVFNSAGEHDFVFPDGIHFIKFTVTGSGATGSTQPGGASSTVIGNLSGAPGTALKIDVGAGFNTGDAAQNGRPSKIYLPTSPTATDLVVSDGGIFEPGQPAFTISDGTINLSNPHVLNGFVIKGGSGRNDTDDGGDEEAQGGSSYFGNAPAPGGGQNTHRHRPIGPPPGDGVVILEWS